MVPTILISIAAVACFSWLLSHYSHHNQLRERLRTRVAVCTRETVMAKMAGSER